MAESDYIGIRGWAAIVKTITPQIENGKVMYVVGSMSLLPLWQERDVKISEKEMCLDVYFHCYTETVAAPFYHEVKVNDNLIVSGDLSRRYWEPNEKSSNTNFWLDNFIVDISGGNVSSLAGKLYASNMQEFVVAANQRYEELCNFCGEKLLRMPAEHSDRMFCAICDS